MNDFKKFSNTTDTTVVTASVHSSDDEVSVAITVESNSDTNLVLTLAEIYGAVSAVEGVEDVYITLDGLRVDDETVKALIVAVPLASTICIILVGLAIP
eukprot:UN04090